MFSLFGITILSDRLLNALKMTSFQEGYQEGVRSRPVPDAFLYGDDEAIETLKTFLATRSIRLNVQDCCLRVDYMSQAPENDGDYSAVTDEIQAILRL